MDLSVIAAVGSFVVSERVLKPKATVLVILGLLLIYDLQTKTHDVSSLRVYRGPAFVAFILMMAAFSLRTWRRNGVACDELIFLPGTQHGHEIGVVDSPLVESVPVQSSSSMNNNDSNINVTSSHSNINSNVINNIINNKCAKTKIENDRNNDSVSSTSDGISSSHSSLENNLEMMPVLHSDNNFSTSELSATISEPKSDDIILKEEESLNYKNEETRKLSGVHSLEYLHNNNHEETNTDEISPTTDHLRTGSTINTNIMSRVQQWFENHPRLGQLWAIFFSRSSSGSSYNDNSNYAPSGPSVFGASLDLSLPVLFNYHIFIVAFNHIQGQSNTSDISVKILPICFMTVLLIRVVIPPSKRFRFWSTMKFTIFAPFYKINVRDEFIGDVLTSWVRPGQDLVYALSYYFTVVWGTLVFGYSFDQCGKILEESWWLHNVVLPLLSILPLFLKYVQCLRSAYDTHKRWPYILNALKYLSASLVIVYGTTHPEKRKNKGWIICFVFALVYQVCWDVVMDWSLFELQRDVSVIDATNSESFIFSVRPESRILLIFQTYIVQPIMDRYQQIKARIPSWKNVHLRKKRLYKTESFYWKIFAFNLVSRFTWMCCFIPAYHVSRTNSTVVLTSTSDVDSYWGVLLPATEIFRRTLWGFLYMENATLKMMDADTKYHQVEVQGADYNDQECDGMESNSKSDESRSFRSQSLPTWLDKQQQVANSAATTGSKQRKQFLNRIFLVEMFIWASAFVILNGLVAR